jgi:hypothetical protein
MTILDASLPRRPFHALLAGGLSATVVLLALSGVAASFGERVALFYLATSIAYVLMPYVRRSDIPLAAMWVVLAVELAPLTVGQMLSAEGVAADVAGIAMATAPIYIARARQMLQGDTRGHSRRAGERLVALRSA